MIARHAAFCRLVFQLATDIIIPLLCLACLGPRIVLLVEAFEGWVPFLEKWYSFGHEFGGCATSIHYELAISQNIKCALLCSNDMHLNKLGNRALHQMCFSVVACISKLMGAK